jgi:hypothetical protein|nr:hypothetical protein Q903MT_gene6003 [Picea sitchensis]
MLSNSFLPVEQDRVGPPVKDGVTFLSIFLLNKPEQERIDGGRVEGRMEVMIERARRAIETAFNIHFFSFAQSSL